MALDEVDNWLSDGHAGSPMLTLRLTPFWPVELGKSPCDSKLLLSHLEMGVMLSRF